MEYDFYTELMKIASKGYFTVWFRWGDNSENTLGVKPDGTVWINGVLTDDGDRIRDALVSFALGAENEKCRYKVVKTKK